MMLMKTMMKMMRWKMINPWEKVKERKKHQKERSEDALGVQFVGFETFERNPVQ